jgi:hypothetical protein
MPCRQHPDNVAKTGFHGANSPVTLRRRKPEFNLGGARALKRPGESLAGFKTNKPAWSPSAGGWPNAGHIGN